MSATSETENAEKRVLTVQIEKLRWCFWHANVKKAQSRMREIWMTCRVVVPQTPKFGESLTQLDYRTRELVAYVEANGGSTINYAKRRREGRPISTAMAESAVNQILNHRMCKRLQMRSSRQGTHLIAQVRCAIVNGDLTERLTAAFRRRLEEIPIEVAVFLDQFRRASESLPQGF